MMIITGADTDRIRVALAVTQSCRWFPESLAAAVGGKESRSSFACFYLADDADDAVDDVPT